MNADTELAAALGWCAVAVPFFLAVVYRAREAAKESSDLTRSWRRWSEAMRMGERSAR